MDNNNFYANLIREIFEEDFSLRVIWEDESCLLRIPLSGSSCSILWNVRISKSGKCKYITYLAKNVPDSVTNDLCRLFSHIQAEYNFVRIYLDADNDLVVDYDFLPTGSDRESLGKAVLHSFRAVNAVIMKFYAEIMKCVWIRPADDDEDDED